MALICKERAAQAERGDVFSLCYLECFMVSVLRTLFLIDQPHGDGLFGREFDKISVCLVLFFPCNFLFSGILCLPVFGIFSGPDFARLTGTPYPVFSQS